MRTHHTGGQPPLPRPLGQANHLVGPLSGQIPQVTADELSLFVAYLAAETHGRALPAADAQAVERCRIMLDAFPTMGTGVLATADSRDLRRIALDCVLWFNEHPDGPRAAGKQFFLTDALYILPADAGAQATRAVWPSMADILADPRRRRPDSGIFSHRETP